MASSVSDTPWLWVWDDSFYREDGSGIPTMLRKLARNNGTKIKSEKTGEELFYHSPSFNGLKSFLPKKYVRLEFGLPSLAISATTCCALLRIFCCFDFSEF